MAHYLSDNISGGQIKIGGTKYAMTEIRYGANLDLVWPLTIQAYLTPSWTYAGNYGLTTIPAGGGYAYATWTLTVVRAGQTVYSGVVTPTSSSIDDTTNFSYTRSDGTWKANDRGTNGYSSDTTPPTSQQWEAPARSCSLSVEYQGNVTIGGESVAIRAYGSAVMTQNRNYASYVTNLNTYDSFAMTIDDASTASSPLPAGQTITYVHPSCRCGNYIKWESKDSGSSTGYAYYYQTIDGASSFDITTPADWITIENGGKLTVISRGTTPGSQRAAEVTATLSIVQTAGYAQVVVYQRENAIDPTKTIPEQNEVLTYYLNNINTSSDPIPCAGGTIAISGYWNGYYTTEYNEYYSGDSTGGVRSYVTNKPANPEQYKIGSGSWVDGAVVNITTNNNHSTSVKTYNIYGKFGGVSTTYAKSLYQAADTQSDYLTRDYAIDYLTISNSTIAANGGSASISARGKHTRYKKWNSDNADVSGTVSTIYDAPNLFTYNMSSPDSNPNAFSITGTSKDTTTGITTATLEHRHMHKVTGPNGSAGTDSVQVKASNNGADDYSAAQTATNARDNGTDIYGPDVMGTPYQQYQNFHFAVTLADYGYGQTPAPKNGGSTTLSVEAWHEEYTVTPWSKTHSVYYSYTSGDSDTVEMPDVTWTTTGTTSVVSDVGMDPTTGPLFISITGMSGSQFSLGTSVVTIDGKTRNTTVVVADNSGNPAAESIIYVTRAAIGDPNHGGQSQTGDNKHIYQKAGNIALACVDSSGNPVTQLSFTKFGGTQTFRVVATSTGWTRTLSYSSTYSPFSGGSVTPLSGSSGTTTITVEIEQHTSTIYGTDHRIGLITFTSTEDSDITASVRVDQYPAVGEG